MGGEGFRHSAARSGTASLALTEIGSGSPVVLLHAGVADRRSWYEVMRALADRFRLVAYDRRGFGETTYRPEPHSAVDDLRAVLDAAGVERAALVGCSAGGMLAAEASFRLPDRVRALVLVDASVAGAPTATDLPERVDALFEAVEAAEQAGDSAEVNRLEAVLWLDGPLTTEGRVGGAARELFLDMNGRALSAPPTGDIEELPARWGQLAEIAVPTLIVVGEHDLPILLDRGRAMAAAIPAARVTVLPDSAHLPMLDHPAALIRELAAFLTTVE